MARSHLLGFATTLLVAVAAALVALAGLHGPAAADVPGASDGAISTASQGSCAEAPNSPNSFPDIPNDSLFCNDIAWVVSSGITQGRADGSFGPGEPVRRGQMAAFLYRFADEPVVPDSAPSFSDIPRSHVFHRAISWLAAEGISLGRGDGTFLPNDTLTRAQMATFLDRALDLDEAEEPAGFTDVPEDFVHAAAIDRLVAAGITTGTGEGVFSPSDPVTRAQMATFLFRALADLDDSDEGGDGEDEANSDD